MTSRQRKRGRDRRTLRVNADARPVDICRETARQLALGLTDAELAQGLRDLADAIEADAAKRKATV